MFKFCPFFSIVILLLGNLIISGSGSGSWLVYQYVKQSGREFEQKTNKFWEFEEKSRSWMQVELPYDLVSCVNDQCKKVNTIEKQYEQKGIFDEDGAVEGPAERFLPIRRRVSVRKMSESSVWVTGESGSIYERFWNGLQWVLAPHELPVSAGYAVSVFIVNHTILALSEAGVLYQMQLDENVQPGWLDFSPSCRMMKEKEPCSASQIVSGVVSPERKRMYFCTKNGSLIELTEVNPPRWKNHGRPAGADVAAIADADAFRQEVVFTISATGDLYEYDPNSRPSWKKHIHKEASTQDTLLMPITGCSLHGLNGAHSASLFLLTKGGNLTERRMQQRKWKWIHHGSPRRDLSLTSITCVSQENLNENAYSLFLTTATGNVFEYRLPIHSSGTTKENENPDNWVNHMHPTNAKAARGISGVQLQYGRMIFPLDDGRLGELHHSGIGGENIGPNYQSNTKRKASPKYIWSILEGPETEGWNAEYCTEQNGPSNCISGTKEETSEENFRTPTTRRRKGQQNYLPITTSPNSIPKVPLEEYNFPDDDWINKNFRLRVMQEGKSFFLITEQGTTFEYLNTENVWFWLNHDQSMATKGALGSYNGSLFLVDEQGSLLIRERTNNELVWINCSSMRRGSKVIGGPPWDGLSGKAPRATLEDSLFFISKTGRLLQFTVALRKFKWKDCRNPPDTKIASIVDREIFRENIVFVIGRNGRLYQYNKVTQLWHQHFQSQHLALERVPGTATRPSPLSSIGSLFMLLEGGGLVEYNWNSFDGWNWVEHGTPEQCVALVGAPGPCFGGSQLFLIGSNGRVYLRFLDHGAWQWRDCGFPYMPDVAEEEAADKSMKKGTCRNEDFAAKSSEFEENLNPINKNCDSKVSSTRPIPFTENSVIFQLRDGRLAEMRKTGGGTDWRWSHTIATPTSLCTENIWTALAS